mmetsp:Transcript_3989/g.8830  ORF Transcript_3989/g.8830 Transcript_3989/m.8830 type:complete len:93 (+) Transcript_3989:107-385(+)
MSEPNAEHSIASNDERKRSSSKNDQTSIPSLASLSQTNNESNRKESQNEPSAIDGEEPPPRRLSTPCLIPMDATDIGVSCLHISDSVHHHSF